MPNITRGDRVAGLMSYLVGEGKREGRVNVHENPHVVAGHEVIVQAAPDGVLSMDDALDLANLLDQPRKVFGTRVTVPVKEWSEDEGRLVKVGDKDAHVWHASLSISAEEGKLSDRQWGRIATDFVNEMGFVDPDGAGSCRWVAVRHGASSEGNDHVHIVVSLVQEDGGKARVHDDFRHAQQACTKLERAYGLRVLESREQSQQALPGVKPAELERARKEDTRTTQREELRRRLRATVAASVDEADFVKQTREARLLVKPRFAKGSTTEVVGFSVALVPAGSEGPIWFAPSKLDTNLGLGQLRQMWNSTPDTEAEAATAWSLRGRLQREGTPDVVDKVRPARLPAEAVQRLNAVADQIVVPSTHEGVDRTAAVHLSTAFAKASMYFERGEHGPFADASDVFARYSQKDRYNQSNVRRTAGSAQSSGDAAYRARLSERATGRDSATGWIAVFRHLKKLGSAVESANRANGNLVAAAQIGSAMQAAVTAFEKATNDAATGAPQPAAGGSADRRRRDREDRGPGHDSSLGHG
jgi:hypothetical protein